MTESGVLWALSIEEDHVNQHRSYVDSVLGRINRRELNLLQVYASYGCTLTCLCTRASPNTLEHKDIIRFMGIEDGP